MSTFSEVKSPCWHWISSPLIRSDQGIPAERFSKLKPFQKQNHFVGMCAITRKNNLGRNLLRMKKYFPESYKFFPDTWILPTDLSDFKAQFSNGKCNKTFIIKPDNGWERSCKWMHFKADSGIFYGSFAANLLLSFDLFPLDFPTPISHFLIFFPSPSYQGRGIFLTRELPANADLSTPLVAQKYSAKPMLLDGYKFDLRLYVLVTGCDPLRVFLHEEGLIRLATEPYTPPKVSNLSQVRRSSDITVVCCRVISRVRLWTNLDELKWVDIVTGIPIRHSILSHFHDSQSSQLFTSLVTQPQTMVHLTNIPLPKHPPRPWSISRITPSTPAIQISKKTTILKTENRDTNELWLPCTDTWNKI